MAEEPQNPLIRRFLNVFGPPDRAADVAECIAEYQRLLSGYGPNVLKQAGDQLMRNAGKYWPSLRQCKEACDDVVEHQAGRAAADSAGKPKTKMPWEIHTEEARAWAREYMKVSEMGQQAQREGWARQLELYAMSYAKQGLGLGHTLPAMKTWKPNDDQIWAYRQPYLKNERLRAEKQLTGTA
jgi:hypothetical protein